jgi:hypothetical protein
MSIFSPKIVENRDHNIDPLVFEVFFVLQAEVKGSRPTKRGLSSQPRARPSSSPPRKSLRLQKIEADRSLQLPEKEPSRSGTDVMI